MHGHRLLSHRRTDGIRWRWQHRASALVLDPSARRLIAIALRRCTFGNELRLPERVTFRFEQRTICTTPLTPRSGQGGGVRCDSTTRSTLENTDGALRSAAVVVEPRIVRATLTSHRADGNETIENCRYLAVVQTCAVSYTHL